MNAVQSVVRFVFACVAANQETGGRCRNPRCTGKLHCNTHQKMVDAGSAPPEALLADVILVKRKISKARADRLAKLGVKEEEGKDPTEKLAAAIADANRQRRSATTYGENRRDGGTLVIDNAKDKGKGAQKVTVAKALVGMRGRYDITGVHLEPTKDQNPHMRQLIVAYTIRTANVAPVCTPDLWKMIHEIFEGVYDVWVYANTPRVDNELVVHTVNLGWFHKDGQPEGHLLFSDAPGTWDVEGV